MGDISDIERGRAVFQTGNLHKFMPFGGETMLYDNVGRAIREAIESEKSRLHKYEAALRCISEGNYHNEVCLICAPNCCDGADELAKKALEGSK